MPRPGLGACPPRLSSSPQQDRSQAYFEGPADRELIFQALDANGMAVQPMRLVGHLHEGERLACQGCRERRNEAPRLAAVPEALRRAPSQLMPEIGPVEPIDYYRTVRSVFERSCLPCHQEKQVAHLDWSYAALEPHAFYFAGGMSRTTLKPIHGGSRTIPGRFGAPASRMGQALLDEAHRSSVSPEDYREIVVWLDSNRLRLGSYVDEEAQFRGGLVWSSLEVDPANPQEGRLTRLGGD